MFQMKQNEPSARRRRIPVYLLKDSDGRAPVESVSLVDGDVLIYQSDGTIVNPTSIDARWTEYSTVSGVYTLALNMVEVNDLGILTVVIDPKSNTAHVTAPDIRRFTKEILIVENVTTSAGLGIVPIEMTSEVLVYLTDHATDLVPQLGLAASDSLPSMKILKGSGTISTAIGAWTELGNGLYKYVSTRSDAGELGFFVLFVEKSEVRTFLKEVQVVETADIVEPEELAEDKYRIPVIAELAIRAAHTKDPKIGPPKYVGFRPKKLPVEDGVSSEGVARQQFEVIFYPKPDKEYTLEYRYRVRPESITEDRKFPQGAHDHSETILACCLALIEERKGISEGPANRRYQELLEQSKALNAMQEQKTGGSIWPNELIGKEDQTDYEIATAPGFNLLALKRDTGNFSGYGTAPASWSHEEVGLVDRAIQTGYRWFVLPYVVPSQKNYVHEWSFLTPLHEFTWDPDSTDRGPFPTVPANFASIVGDIALKEADSGWAVIKHVSEEKVREFEENSGRQSGTPRVFAFRTINSERDAGDPVVDERVSTSQQNTQKWEIVFWPSPDQKYTYEFTYTMNPFPLRGDNIIPFGSPIHSETIKYGCIAAAEVDIKGIVGGPMFNQFLLCLEKSISFDERAIGPQHLGYNGDRSVGRNNGFLAAVRNRHCDRNKLVRYITD